MPPAKACSCKTCKRQFGETVNDVEVKQRGSLAQCSGCFYFIKSSPTYRTMTRTQLTEHLSDPVNANKFVAEVDQYIADRKSGKTRHCSNKDVTTVAAESKTSLVTRSLKGYLWTKELLEKHNLSHEWKKNKVTSVTHMGAKVTGMLKESFVLGSIEIYEDSSHSAVRSQVAADAQPLDDEAQEQAADAFQNMTKQLKGQVEEDDGSLLLKPAHKKPKEDHDDFMDLWGVPAALGGQASSSSGQEKVARNKNQPADGEERKSKRAKTVVPSVGVPNNPSDSAESSSQAGQAAGSSLNTSWMFQGKLYSKASKQRASEHSKDFDLTEKAIVAVEGLKLTISKQDTFLSITYQKARSAFEKIQSRNTEALQAMYRESSQSGDARGLDLLRRVTACEKEMQCILDLVSALHDSEASSRTLMHTAAAARAEGLSIPKFTDQLCRARSLNELAKEEEWEEYLKAMDIAELSKDDSVFAPEEEELMLDFQASSLMSTLKTLLMQEVKIEKKDKGDLTEAECAERDELLLNEAKTNVACEKVLHFLNVFMASSVEQFMKGKSTVSQLFEDMLRMQRMIILTFKSEGAMGDKEADELKALRVHFVASKKGIFHECMTLFPVGLHITNAAAEVCSSFHRDKGFARDLEEIGAVVDSLKALTGDSLLKKATNASGQQELEFQIPQSSKVFDMTTRQLGYIFLGFNGGVMSGEHWHMIIYCNHMKDDRQMID